MPVTERLSLRAKSDQQGAGAGARRRRKSSTSGIGSTNNWDVSTGVRDRRAPRRLARRAADAGAGRAHRRRRAGRLRLEGVAGAPTASCRTRCRSTATARRTAASARAARIRISERLKVDAEVSDGDLGAGGKVGTNYLHNDRTTLYLNYALENERTDNGCCGDARQRRQYRRRRQDAALGQHERVSRGALSGQRSDPRASRTRRASASRRRERLNLGASTDIGTLRDMLTGAETERRAGGFRVGYGFERAAALERRRVPLRRDRAARSLARATRETWLWRNNFKYQLSTRRAAARQAQPLRQRELARAVLRRRLYRGRARLRVSARAPRSVEHAGQVHVLLQRADDGSDHAAEHGRGVHPEEPRRGGRPDVRPHAALVDRRQVRAPPRRDEP